MEQQAQANGRHRVVYAPRRDPLVQEHAVALGEHCARIILQAVAAVSPHQRDPDGHRALIATQLTKAMLTEVYRMVGAVTALLVERSLPANGSVMGAAQAPIVRPPRVVQARPRGAAPGAPVPRRAVVNRRGG